MSQAVIIVDDAGEYRDTLVRLLHHQTYQVILASDVDEALDGLWANGARVKAIYVSGRMLDLVDLTALMEVLDRDWPKVAVITTPRVDETVGRQFERVLLVPEHAEAAVIASTLLGGSHSGGKFSH